MQLMYSNNVECFGFQYYLESIYRDFTLKQIKIFEKKFDSEWLKVC